MALFSVRYCLNVESLKNSPVLKAMKARAISERKSIPSMTVAGTRFKQNGPIRMPTTMYAVTFGSRSRFVNRVIEKPKNSIKAMEIITVATEFVSITSPNSGLNISGLLSLHTQHR